MNRVILVLVALSTMSIPAFGQAAGDEGRYFHLRPPSYSIPPSRKRAVHRMAKGIRWYHEHLGDKPLEDLSGNRIP